MDYTVLVIFLFLVVKEVDGKSFFLTFSHFIVDNHYIILVTLFYSLFLFQYILNVKLMKIVPIFSTCILSFIRALITDVNFLGWCNLLIEYKTKENN